MGSSSLTWGGRGGSGVGRRGRNCPSWWRTEVGGQGGSVAGPELRFQAVNPWSSETASLVPLTHEPPAKAQRWDWNPGLRLAPLILREGGQGRGDRSEGRQGPGAPLGRPKPRESGETAGPRGSQPGLCVYNGGEGCPVQRQEPSGRSPVARPRHMQLCPPATSSSTATASGSFLFRTKPKALPRWVTPRCSPVCHLSCPRCPAPHPPQPVRLQPLYPEMPFPLVPNGLRGQAPVGRSGLLGAPEVDLSQQRGLLLASVPFHLAPGPPRDDNGQERGVYHPSPGLLLLHLHGPINDTECAFVGV